MDSLRKALMELTQSASPVGILTHINPDGDGFCAALFMAKWLSLHKVDSLIVTDGDDLALFEHLLADAQVQPYHPEMSFATLLILDCNNIARLGERKGLLDKASQVYLIDHHEVEVGLIPAQYSFIEQSFVSVGAILFEALEDQLQGLPPDVRTYLASCLYTTILNDTNTFTNGNTTATVLDQAARMAALGANPSLLHRQYFQNQSWQEIRYTGEVLGTTQVYENGKVLLIYSTLQMAEDNDIIPADVLNVTRWVQGVRGIEAVIFIREESPGYFKLSFRSKKVDVSRFAARYGGGGHSNASGCHLQGELNQIKQMILDDFIQVYREIDAQQAQ